MGKRLLCLIMVVLLGAVSTLGLGEGLLPLLTDAYGVPMPSLGTVLHRYPNYEETDANGSVVQNWDNVHNSDFDLFSEYLVKVGAELLDYKLDAGIFTATIEKDGKSFSFVYDQQNENATVTYPQGTYDEWCFDAESHYNNAQEYMKNGQFADALSEFEQIKDYALYKDVDNLLKTDKSLTHEKKIEPFKQVGNIVSFGHYEQDASDDNGPEEIKWIVLDTQEGKSLLLSRYGLDAKRFNEVEGKDLSWGNSTLRQWLNNDFLQKAFSKEEQSAIHMTSVDNSAKQQYYKEKSESNTQDRVFLLSYYETYEKYLQDKDSRMCPTTEYAFRQGAWPSDRYEKDGKWVIKDYSYPQVDGIPTVMWWLRSFGHEHDEREAILDSGYMSEYYSDRFRGPRHTYICVRPAIWIDLESDFF